MDHLAMRFSETKDSRCCVCGCEEFTFLREGFDDRYGHPDRFLLVACSRCGHVLTSPTLTEDDLGDLYSDYYPRSQIDTKALVKEAALVRATLAPMRRWWAGTDNQGQYRISPGQRMLDVGCGTGLSLLEARHLGAEAFGIEADPNVQMIAQELDLNIHIGSLHDDPFPGLSFDLIVLNQVIEHIPDPGGALEILKQRLKRHGRLVLAFPNRRSLWQAFSGSRWINWHLPYHLHHFDKGGFRRLAERHGLRVVSLKTVTPTLWTRLQLKALRHNPKLGVPSPLWQSQPPTPTLARISPRRLARPLLQVSLTLLNRFIDVIGLGDSVVVELKPRDSA